MPKIATASGSMETAAPVSDKSHIATSATKGISDGININESNSERNGTKFI
jgi:hypothetical protein